MWLLRNSSGAVDVMWFLGTPYSTSVKRTGTPAPRLSSVTPGRNTSLRPVGGSSTPRAKPRSSQTMSVPLAALLPRTVVIADQKANVHGVSVVFWGWQRGVRFSQGVARGWP